jgi:hypothetical protein
LLKISEKKAKKKAKDYEENKQENGAIKTQNINEKDLNT